MKKYITGAVFLLFAAAWGVAQSAPAPLPAIKIILVGDSTMAPGNGWGPGFCDRVAPQVICVNLAKNGRSSSSYRAEGSWAKVMDEVSHKAGFKQTYVFIQFGHNDQPGKPGRSTDLATEFPANLRRYVTEVRTAGAKPVLITPLSRRQFKAGQLQNGLAPWAEATKKVAAEAGTPLLDLNRDSHAAIQNMGAAEANTLAMEPPPPVIAEAANKGDSPEMAMKLSRRDGHSVGVTLSAANAVPANNVVEHTGAATTQFDYTHLGPKGAALFGRMIADELRNAVAELRPYLKAD